MSSPSALLLGLRLTDISFCTSMMVSWPAPLYIEHNRYRVDVPDRDVLLRLHLGDVELEEFRVDAERRQVEHLAGLHDGSGSVHGLDI